MNKTRIVVELDDIGRLLEVHSRPRAEVLAVGEGSNEEWNNKAFAWLEEGEGYGELIRTKQPARRMVQDCPLYCDGECVNVSCDLEQANRLAALLNKKHRKIKQLEDRVKELEGENQA